MQQLSQRVEKALARNEIRAERVANRARLAFLALATIVVALNLPTVDVYTNTVNFSAVGVAWLYGLAVFLTLKRSAYRPAMKYVTSLLDVTLVCLALLFYTTMEVPSVALKNPAFLFLFPLIALTVLRHDPRLAAVTGGYAVLLYGCLLAYAWPKTAIPWGDYRTELFTENVTVIGQATKILILIAYVAVASYLARDTRGFLHRLVHREVAVRGAKEAMERELELASLVQAQLLPRGQPPVEGLRMHGMIAPGRYVGGDYYDFIKLSDATVLLVVADVAGKGVPAALIMSAVRASVHLFTAMNLTLEDLVVRLNAQVYESTPPASYLTLFAAEIDAVRNSISYINAGHTPSILYSSGRILFLESGTLPLGMFPSLPAVRAARQDYPPGSILVACTDGVWERANSQGDLFGESVLRQFVEDNSDADCVAFTRKLLERVRAYGGNRPLEDDATLAVARIGLSDARNV